MLWQLMAIHEIKKAAREFDAQQKAYERNLLRDEDGYDEEELDEEGCPEEADW